MVVLVPGTTSQEPLPEWTGANANRPWPYSRSVEEQKLRLFGSFIPVDFQEALQIFLVLFLSSLSFCLPQGEDDKNIIGRLHSSAN